MSKPDELGSESGAELRSAAEYLPFVRKVAQRMARRLPGHISVEELVSAGVVGLLEAMKRYDPERVTNFETYAEFRVKGAILDDLRRRDLMARDARIEVKQIEKAIGELANEFGREPEEDELAAHLGLTVDNLRERMQKLIPVRVVSINDLYPASAASSDDTPFEAAAKNELLARLAKALSRLNPRHQQVLQLYYREELTLREIGEVLGVTESRVCQIVSEATVRLRSLLGAERTETDQARRRMRKGAA